MKRKDLIKRANKIAKANGHTLTFLREGGSHTIYEANGQRIVVPRHNEVNDRTAQAILDTVTAATANDDEDTDTTDTEEDQ